MVAKIEAEKIRQKRTDEKRKRMLRKTNYPLMFLLAFLRKEVAEMAPRQNKIALVNRFASVSIEAKRLVAAIFFTLLLCGVLPLVMLG